ncbi:MAG: PIN domain-containing protein [Oscillospiraceae bacterium]|jgi:predicted nucleic acid-binding protein|nr:PIN domain-containing protein [Oscillospiraceae bacterium]
MILVDTSVIIDTLKKVQNPKQELFEQIRFDKIDYGISIYTYHEVLQGARTGKEFSELVSFLDAIPVYFLKEDKYTYANSANLYFSLRRNGITIRNTVDVMIAPTAINNNFPLLHNDRDFDLIATIFPILKILAK